MQNITKLLGILAVTLAVVCIMFATHTNNLQEEQARQKSVLQEIKESVQISQKHQLSSKDEVKTEVGSLQSGLDTLKDTNSHVTSVVDDFAEKFNQQADQDNQFKEAINSNFEDVRTEISELRTQFEELKGLSLDIKTLLDSLSEKIANTESNTQIIVDDVKKISVGNNEQNLNQQTTDGTNSNEIIPAENSNEIIPAENSNEHISTENINTENNGEINTENNTENNAENTIETSENLHEDQENTEDHENNTEDVTQEENQNTENNGAEETQYPDPDAEIPNPDSNNEEDLLTTSEIEEMVDQMEDNEDNDDESWLRTCVQETIPGIGEMNELKIRQLLDVANTPTYECNKQQHFGDQETGQWNVCLETMNASACVVYAFGFDLSVAFEVSAAETLGCEVHIFDYNAAAYIESIRGTLPQNVHYHQYELGNIDGQLSVEVDKQVELKTLATIMEELGHESIDYLKLDIAGSEIPVLDDIFSDHLELLQQIDQLAIDFHYGEQYSSQPLEKTVVEMTCIFDGLREVGFQIFHKSEMTEDKTQTYFFIRSERNPYNTADDEKAGEMGKLWD